MRKAETSAEGAEQTPIQGLRPPLNRGLLWLQGRGLGERTLKTALASGLAWQVGTVVPGGTAHPYFAPLAALLSLQITVAESIAGALQRIAGIVAGVGVALLATKLAGETALGVALMILLALVVGVNLRLTAQGVSQVAVSALLVLSVGGATSLSYAGSRIVESIVGAVIGVTINALLVPPNLLPGARRAQQALGAAVVQVLDHLSATVASGVTRDEMARCLQEARALRQPLANAQEALERADRSLTYNVLRRDQRIPLQHYRYRADALEHTAIQVRGLTRALTEIIDSAPSAQALTWLAPEALGTPLAALFTALARAVDAATRLFTGDLLTSVTMAEALHSVVERHAAVERAARLQQPPLPPEAWMQVGTLLAVAVRMHADLRAIATVGHDDSAD